MKSFHERFEKFKMDEKEFAIFSALLVVSQGN